MQHNSFIQSAQDVLHYDITMLKAHAYNSMLTTRCLQLDAYNSMLTTRCLQLNAYNSMLTTQEVNVK